MTKHDKYKDVPHFELIEENKPIVIASIFMFEGCTDLFSFLRACEAYNCKVFFTNEKLVINPCDNVCDNPALIGYTAIMCCRKIGDDYVRYLSNLAKMQWVQGEHEPILK